MARVDDYRRYAAACLRLAGATSNAQEKAQLLQMAQKWRELADRAEAEIKKKDD
jgi:hypothetical protein